jgi:hypothetical protein
MAIWTQIYGTDLWSAAVTKINDVIGSYNTNFGGTENQRKVKGSATDFDTAWCDPEGKINSTSTFDLDTLVVGDTKNISISYHSYSSEGKIAIKAYSLANSENYILGKITSITNNQIIVVEIFEIGGTGSHTDMVVVPYGFDYEQTSITQTSTFPNAIFASAPTIANGTLNFVSATLIRNGNQITISGQLLLTTTNTSFGRNITLGTLQSEYAIKDGASQYVMGTMNISHYREIATVGLVHSETGFIDNNGGITNNSTILYLRTNNIAQSVLSSRDYQYNFNITYIVA